MPAKKTFPVLYRFFIYFRTGGADAGRIPLYAAVEVAYAEVAAFRIYQRIIILLGEGPQCELGFYYRFYVVMTECIHPYPYLHGFLQSALRNAGNPYIRCLR